MRRLMNADYLRYLVVALACALLNNSILIIGDRLGVHYGALIGLCCLITGNFAYLLHSGFTFRRRTGWVQYGRFMAGIVLGMPAAWLFMFVLRSLIGLPMWIAAPTATVLMLIYNFLSARFAILLQLTRGRVDQG